MKCEEGIPRGNETSYDGKERRGIRTYVVRCYYDNIEALPQDKKSIEALKSYMLNFLDYSYRRVTDLGYVEECMIEEMYNIAFLCEKYYALDPELLGSFYINLFSIALEKGEEYNKNLVAELLTKSEFIFTLSKYIYQITSHVYDIKIINIYNDFSVDTHNRNMIFIMSNYVFEDLSKEYAIDVEKVSIDELLKGIESEFFDIRNEKVKNKLGAVIRDECNKNNNKKLAKKIINLGIRQYIDLLEYDEYLREYDLYKLLYYPEQIDYEKLDLNNFVSCKSQTIINNAVKYGGSVLISRIYDEYKKNKKIKKSFAFRNILFEQKYSRIKRPVIKRMAKSTNIKNN